MDTLRALAVPVPFGFAFATAVSVSPVRAEGETRPSRQKPSGGTVKGAAVGTAAGHVLGGHTETGAAVGAVAGHHERKKSEERIQNGGKLWGGQRSG